MKVTLVNHPHRPLIDSGRGIDRYCYYLSNGLPNKNILVKNINAIDSNNMFIRNYFSVPLKLVELSGESSDIYHSVAPDGAQLALLLNKSPLVTNIHDVIPFYDSTNKRGHLKDLYGKMYTKMVLNTINKSQRLIVPFNYTKNWLLENLFIDDSKISVINYGVEIKKHNEKKVGSEETLSNIKNYFIFIGGGRPILRGLPIVLKAFSYAMRDIEDYLLISLQKNFGTLSQYELAIKMIGRYNLGARVKIVNFIPELSLPHVLRNARALLFPSTMGFSFLELQAMMVGTPVITTNCYDNVEFIQNSGIICPINDINCFSKAIVLISTNKDFYSLKSNESLKRSKSFSVSRMLDSTIQLYESL
jgi:glycosyltransferase involved in cell wall biosynthesis